MTLYSPYMALGRNTLYTSNIVNGDLDTAAKIAAINAAMAQTGVQTVVFDRAYNLTLARTDLVDATAAKLFSIPSGRRVIGDPLRPLDMSMMPNSGSAKYLFRAEGTAGTSQALTADLANGIGVAVLDAPKMTALGLVNGDRVSITSDRLFIAGGTVGTEECGEIATVVSTTATGFTFYPAAQDSYTVADAAKVQKLTMARIGLEGLRAIGPGQFATDVVGDRMLHLVWCDGLEIDGLASEYFDNGNYLYSCPDGRATDFRAIFQPAGGRTSNQYGLAAVNACQDFVIDSAYIVSGKHGVVQTESSIARGVTRRLTVKNCTVTGTWNYGIAMHTNAEQITVERNTVVGCSGGLEAGCRSFVSRNNTIRQLRYLAGDLGTGIGINEVCEDVLSSGDRVYDGGFGIRLETGVVPLLSGSVGPVKIKIENFLASGSNQDGIRIKWDGAGARYDVDLRDICTFGIGQPVDAVTGLPDAAGVPTAASSIDVRGNAAGDLGRVKVDGANLQAFTGSGGTNTATALITQFCAGVHVNDVSYVNHAAPSLSGTGVVSSEINAW